VIYTRVDPREDGVGHINIYSRGRTPLGVWMSNFTPTPIHIKGHGDFACIEAYWYWLKSGDDALRTLTGSEAKYKGRASAGKGGDPHDFQIRIRQAILTKTVQHQGVFLHLLGGFKANPLPLAHYYTTPEWKSANPAHNWVIEFMEYLLHAYVEMSNPDHDLSEVRERIREAVRLGVSRPFHVNGNTV
jgi:hypothetical protein